MILMNHENARGNLAERIRFNVRIIKILTNLSNVITMNETADISLSMKITD